jgi:hypothetical protein
VLGDLVELPVLLEEDFCKVSFEESLAEREEVDVQAPRITKVVSKIEIRFISPPFFEYLIP